MERSLRGDDAREMSEKLLRTYFRTQDYPFTRHHIESFDQFLSQDLPAIIKSQNPLTLIQDQIGTTGVYALKAEIFVGGIDGDRIYIGTPTLSLKNTEEIRVLFPNEARLRNLSYTSVVEADIVIRLTISSPNPAGGRPTSNVILMDPIAEPIEYGYLAKYPLMKMPIMLHSRYCVLHGKPQLFLRDVGECVYDQGGYFIVDGSEKVLVTRQEQAFNTLTISPQERDPEVSIYSSIVCLNPTTRQIKRVAFGWLRQQNTLQVSVPFVRKPVPVFVLFRAMGLQADEDIVRMIFPDPESAEAKILEPLLHESILDAFPFLDTFSAIQYMKTMTKGFSEAHVLDILHNQLFIHVENRPGARIAFLAECVRKVLRVFAGIDSKTDRDDIRNQRCLTSGVLTRMLFQDAYTAWKKAALLTLDKEYKYNKSGYKDIAFKNLFQEGTLAKMFRAGMITETVMRAFKGKWGGGGGGDEKGGVIQSLSRLSYLDFMSHCRRVVLDFDTGMKLPGPRRLHTSQFGYFCTSETPGGASIGISKNLSMLTAVSTGTEPAQFIQWLFSRGEVITCDQVTSSTHSIAVPIFVNAGIVGYTLQPIALTTVLKAFKWTGCLPASASISFSIRERRVLVFLDEGRPLRPLIHLGPGGTIPPVLQGTTLPAWRDLLLGNLPQTKGRSIYQSGFMDPLEANKTVSLEEYNKVLAPHFGAIEYVDPYEANEAFVAMFPEYIKAESSHLEIHPSTIVGLLTSMIPFPNHNQSPRNQLSCSQSKQGLSVYATNYPNRFDNQVHVLCYGEAPICRTLYYDYLADGQMPYGQNVILALTCFTGYNQEDGIVFNADSFQRGMFRSIALRSYEAFEEDDMLAKTKTRIGNPARIPGWTSLKAGIDYSKLDERGIIRVGEWVDETTVLVGRYLQTTGGEMRDASVTAQVWTSGRVEKVAITTNNAGLALVKIRVTQDRQPELGDKFSTRHGQKGTMGMLIRAHDMPRSASGMVPDMVVNPHCMPSRMTMAQLLESLLGKSAAGLGAIGNATAFMNSGDPSEQIGKVLVNQLGLQPLGEEILYDGASGQMIPSSIFVGTVYTMRLKHMVEDKWNARAEGRREQRTHQPTGGRGAQGGLRIGEMERDAIVGHGVMDFVRESIMKRADGYSTYLCNGCGTIPIYNETKRQFICPMCDGPVRFVGDSASNLEVLPPNKRSLATFSKVEIPYALKLLDQELSFFMNIGMRFLTDHDITKLRGPPIVELTADEEQAALNAPLPERTLIDTKEVEKIEPKKEFEIREEDLSALGVAADEEAPMEKPNPKILNAAVNAAVTAAIDAGPVSNARISAAATRAAVDAAVSASKEVSAAAAADALGAEEGLTGANMNSVNSIVQNLNLVSAQQTQQPLQGIRGRQGNPEEPDTGLEEVDMDSIPEHSGPQTGGSQRGGQGQGQGINVQTSTQPVLVVPLNIGSSAPKDSFIPGPTPDAPNTYAIGSHSDDTDQGQRQVQPQGGGFRSRSRSNSSGSLGSTKSSGGGSSGPTPSNVKVTVFKQG
jgi:DNA-directed RNA polymerase II subunit RPB2